MGIQIRVGDEVQVRISRRGERRRAERRSAESKRAEVTRGKVTSVDRERGLVVVEGHNLRITHLKRSQRHPQGGRLEREGWIPMSKVTLVADDGKPVRLSAAGRRDGRVVRTTGAAAEASK